MFLFKSYIVPLEIGISLKRLYTERLKSFNSYSTFSRVLKGVVFIFRYYPILRSLLTYSFKVPTVSVTLIITYTFSSVSLSLSFNQLNLFPFPIPFPLYGNGYNKGRSAKSAIFQLKTSFLSLGFKRLYTASLLLKANKANQLPLASILFSPYRVTNLPFLRTSTFTYIRLTLANYKSLVF